ncbi:hypothetical protein NM688_g4892 [Phlebia brevispora]|uniref:Uncharacterized protein n=1 Tax=Phlebia brevispora TaxID=194682 RepID=A0ACC1T1N0_9APHY|nr:hypothetical protein NM688_g4892 [Phlebia brevispora]
MSSPHLKAVIFDIGGVVCRSPLIAIAKYEREHNIPNNYINCSITRRGSQGAWQKFERGEMSLFAFYEAFGRELSETTVGNVWYEQYCKRKGTGAHLPGLIQRDTEKLMSVSTFPECPPLPEKLDIDGRELFGRMMRESATYDELMVEAIRRIRAAGRWRVIALTNNFTKTDAAALSQDKPLPARYASLNVDEELAWLGWQDGAVSPRLRAMFDDFCDSSELGVRKPEPEIYLIACRRNNIEPREAVFLDDLGMNLKAAQALGMETIHVPIGGAFGALKKLENKLGIDLTSGFEPSEFSPSRL